MRAYCISFDGLDGTGKTTAVAQLKGVLEAAGLKVWAGAPLKRSGLARTLRDDPPPLDSDEALDAWLAPLVDLKRTLLPEYDVVLWDRGPLSLLSFASFHLQRVEPERLHQACLRLSLYADLSLILTAPWEVCMARDASKLPTPPPRGEEYFRAFARSMDLVETFLLPRLQNRLQRFTEGPRAVDWCRETVMKLRTHLDLHLTNACPHHCAHCCFSAGEQVRVEPRLLDQVQTVVTQALEIGIREFHLLGGEPLILGERLLDLLRFIRAGGGTVHLLTSGASRRPDAARLAEEAIALSDAVFVSVDGPESVHNQTRGAPIYAEMLAFLKQAQQQRKRIRIGTLVSSLNLGVAARVPDLLLEEGIQPSSLCFMNMSPTGGFFAQKHGRVPARDALSLYLSADAWIDFVEGLLADPVQRARGWVRVEPAYTRASALLGCELHQGKRRLLVMADGAVYTCPMLTPLAPEGSWFDSPDPRALLYKLLFESPDVPTGCGNGHGCMSGCPGYAALFGSLHGCDARCGWEESLLPEFLRLSPARLREGYRPCCPCRVISVGALAALQNEQRVSPQPALASPV